MDLNQMLGWIPWNQGEQTGQLEICLPLSQNPGRDSHLAGLCLRSWVLSRGPSWCKSLSFSTGADGAMAAPLCLSPPILLIISMVPLKAIVFVLALCSSPFHSSFLPPLSLVLPCLLASSGKHRIIFISYGNQKWCWEHAANRVHQPASMWGAASTICRSSEEPPYFRPMTGAETMFVLGLFCLSDSCCLHLSLRCQMFDRFRIRLLFVTGLHTQVVA